MQQLQLGHHATGASHSFGSVPPYLLAKLDAAEQTRLTAQVVCFPACHREQGTADDTPACSVCRQPQG